MKKILLCIAVLCGYSPLHAEFTGHRPVRETRSVRFERLIDAKELAESRIDVNRSLLEPRQVGGRLTTTSTPYFESLFPYNIYENKFRVRPVVIDDLYYETLLLQDPVALTERYYPLIARAIRYPEDLAYVVFEINPQAKFQDGSPITPKDVLRSIDLRLNANSETRIRWNTLVSAITVTSGEVKIDLLVRGQMARDAIAFIAKTKIVKENLDRIATGDVETSVFYIGSGPYRIASFSKSRLLLVRDDKYWGWNLNARQGFFNFSEVEVIAALDQRSARSILNGTLANFYQEKNLANPPLESTIHAHKNMKIKSQDNRTAGQPLRSLQFNLHNRHTSNPLVREALILAFDFDGANEQFYSRRLKRPLSLLDESSFAPSGEPNGPVLNMMNVCAREIPKGSALPFEAYGNSVYRSMYDHQSRLLAAKSRLVEAGYQLVKGRQTSLDRYRTPAPLSVGVLYQEENDLPALELFQRDLASIGVTLTITHSTSNESFQRMADTGDYALVSQPVTMLNTDGWPDVLRLRSELMILQAPCMDKLLKIITNMSTRSDLYRYSAEAIARAHQAMSLNIFLGEARKVEYAVDNSIGVPSGLSLERVHMYGFSIDVQNGYRH